MPRKALRASPSTLNKSQPFALPPPVGGWNARDALAIMPITDAERLDNWFPDTTFVAPRTGSLTYSTTPTSPVQTAMQWAGGTSVKLIVAVASHLMNIATVGSASSVSASTVAGSGTYTNDKWQYVNFGAGGGNYLMMVNGADPLVGFNGSSASVQRILFTDSATTTNLTNINEYQQRLYFTKSGSLSFYYMQLPNAISGTAAPFDLSGIMSSGGELVAMGTWTRDNGDGMDDMAAFVSSQGQVAVYQGIDPSQATSWSLVGVYNIPKPIGYRCVEKFGGDLLILTAQGALPLSSAVGGPVQEKSYITDKIRKAFTVAAATYRNTWGWQIKYFADGNWLIINIPVTGGGSQQYVMNTNTGAWCRFIGLQAWCWEVYNNRIFFGASNKVIQANIGTNDDGVNIAVDAKQAPTVCDMPGVRKKFNLFRPHMATNGTIPLAFGINVDFGDAAPTNIPTPVAVAYPIWDLATWDQFYWGDSAQIVSAWYSPQAFGTYAAVRIKGAVNTEEIQWFGTDIAFEAGGLI